MVNGRTNEHNSQWKGDNVQYTALHDWLRRLTRCIP